MNILVDDLPETVEIDGSQHPINSDFRPCLRTILAFEDDELTGFEKQLIMVQNIYPKAPLNMQAAVAQAATFLNGGRDHTEGEDQPRLFSLAKDAGMIFSAFRQTHGIDLETVELHWWKFLALFMDLGSDTTFCNLVALRKRLKSGKATKEEREAAMEMGDMIEVPEPDLSTPEEHLAEDAFMRALGAGK